MCSRLPRDLWYEDDPAAHDQRHWPQLLLELPGGINTVRRFTAVGRLLIALRIAKGMTQRELADRLGVSEAVVSRDERNDYHGITLVRAQRILDVLQAGVAVRVEELLSQEDVRDLMSA